MFWLQDSLFNSEVDLDKQSELAITTRYRPWKETEAIAL